jgi:uncharacterized membrane protein required for colicin V production
MEFMGLHIVEVVIVGLVAFLAIKGLVNGFSKELLNFITIVAGVLIAARYNIIIVQLINEQDLFPQITGDFVEIIGFILILLSIWLLISLISSIITKLTSRPISFLSRVLGYVLSAARYVFIFSLIIYWYQSAEYFEERATKLKAETQYFELMADWGAMILNIDSNETVVKDNNATMTTKEVNLTEVNATDVNLTKKPSTVLIEHNSSN